MQNFRLYPVLFTYKGIFSFFYLNLLRTVHFQLAQMGTIQQGYSTGNLTVLTEEYVLYIKNISEVRWRLEHLISAPF